MLLDGRGPFLTKLKIPGLDGDVNSKMGFAFALETTCTGDCPNCANNATVEPKTGWVPHKHDVAWLNQRLLQVDRLQNLRESMSFYKFSGQDDKLEAAINEAELLCKDDPESLKRLMLDAEPRILNDKESTDDVVNIMEAAVASTHDSLNVFDQYKVKFGIRAVPLSGWGRDG